MTEKPLLDRIQDLTQRSKSSISLAHIYWGPNRLGDEIANSLGLDRLKDLCEHEPKLQLLNHVSKLSTTSAIERYELTRDLLKLWFSKDDEQSREVFGLAYQLYKDSDIYATLTGERTQLRFWHGLCGAIRTDHVDSCGEGMLLHISGDNIGSYIGMTEELIAPGFKVPTGTIFARRRYETLPKNYLSGWGGFQPIDYSKFIERDEGVK